MVPAVSFADTSVVNTYSPVQLLITQLAQVQSQFNNVMGTTTPPFLGTSYPLSKGEAVQEPDQKFTVGVIGFAHTGVSPAVPSTLTQPPTELAELMLQYNPCVDATSTTCVNTYHSVPSDLALGQSTNYQNYDITLTGLSSTTATLVITNSTFIAMLQNELNGIGASLRTLIGS
jgi:hypothetical protein